MNSAKKLLVLMGKAKQAWSVVFNGTTTIINAGSEASLDDLHAGAFTAEIFVNPNLTGNAFLFAKRGSAAALGWSCLIGTSAIGAVVFSSTTNAESNVITTTGVSKKWNHIVMTYSNAGDRKIYIAINGIWQTYTTQTAAVGTIVSDASVNASIGNRGDGFVINGNVGWARFSNNVRYTVGTNFVAPSRLTPPDNDINTVRLFKMNEGTGTTIIDYSTNAQNATLANGTWTKN